MEKPRPHTGLRHLALNTKNLAACKRFYSDLLGFKIVWEPDPKNSYLSSGTDNLALHEAPADFSPSPQQNLDHLGLFLVAREDVDAWHTYLEAQGVTITVPPKDHRDGSRSFYCADPDGNIVQLIYYPLQ